jgi:hypothetical protein
MLLDALSVTDLVAGCWEQYLRQVVFPPVTGLQLKPEIQKVLAWYRKSGISLQKQSIVVHRGQGENTFSFSFATY